MINLQILVGRVGANPDYRINSNGKHIYKFSVATKSYYNNSEHTEWHNVVCFGKLAQTCQRVLTKGSLIYVQGKQSTSKNGEKYWTECIAETIQFLNLKREEE